MADNGFDLRNLPPDTFRYGLQEGWILVRANTDLEAIEIAFRGEFEIVLSPTAAVDLILKLADALTRLEDAQGDRA